jgi:amidohydrolase
VLESARPPSADRVNHLVEELVAELVDLRRDIHAHPELGRTERRTTDLVADRLRAAGLEPRLLPGTGLVCDIGPGAVATGRRRIMLRADLDALPVPDRCGEPWESDTSGVAHACGHDVHTAVVLGAGLVLAQLDAAGELATGVRLLFQAAEEIQPGGALDAIEAGAMEGVAQVFAVHCDPKLEVGYVGTRIGAITSASDTVTVNVTAPGGHTSRPHLTGDVVYALGKIVTEVPAVLGRRLDPRAGVNLTWGMIQAGAAVNAIPSSGTVRGTLRCLEARTWEEAIRVLREAVAGVAAPYGIEAEVHHQRGVPPVENDDASTRLLDSAAREVLGPEAVTLTEQSLGGEDFAWLLTRAPGAMARLGTRSPGGRVHDLHQGDFRIDERAIGIGARVLARAAVLAGRPGAGREPLSAPAPASISTP